MDIISSILGLRLEHTGFDISGMDEDGLRNVCKQLGIAVEKSMGKGKLVDEIFSEKCEHHFIQPTFITDYPIEMSPLTKKHRSKATSKATRAIGNQGKQSAASQSSPICSSAISKQLNQRAS